MYKCLKVVLGGSQYCHRKILMLYVIIIIILIYHILLLLRTKVKPGSYAVLMVDTLSMDSSHQSVYVHLVLVVDFVLVSEIFLYLNNSIYT